jgi:uncharacterized surface protein with fasciclin (FAS1) repeats
MRTPFRVLAVTAAIALTAAACSSDDNSESQSEKTSTTTTAEVVADETIVDIAAGNEDFSTLVTAVTEADLVDTLSGEGPFTVFAPTDDAFAAIPSDQLTAILADQEQLTAILTYHVLPAEVMAGDLQPTQTVETVQGDTVEINVVDGQATINGCNIVTTDIEASNGVIHVIDCVLLPPSAQ